MSWANYHSHTHFCDGTAAPEEYIEEAIRQNHPAYGFSSHAPVPFPTDWTIKPEKLNQYITEVKQLKERYADQIQIFLGLEIDFLPALKKNGHRNQYPELDYCIHSIHFVDQFEDGNPWNIDTSSELFASGLEEIFNNDMKKAGTRFWALSREMIETLEPDVIGHLDKIKMFNKSNCYFNEQDNWYVEQVEETLDLLQKKDCIVEINTRGFYRYGQPDLYPGEWIIRRIAEKNIPVVINSDAHKPKEISEGMSYAAEILEDCGIREVYALNQGKWQACSFSPEGIRF